MKNVLKCTKGCDTEEFYATEYLRHDGLYDKYGNFLEELHTGESLGSPEIFICKECGELADWTEPKND